MDAATEIDELRAALATRDADLAARDADLAARDDHIARLEEQLDRVLAQLGRVAELEAELAKLRELLGRDSSNSNKPPSSDPPGTGAKAPKEKKSEGRRRGGQRGHEGSHRGLLPAERMDAFEDHLPCTCARCHASLPQTPDPGAKRYPHLDLDRDGVFRTEHRGHRVQCPSCGHKTWAKYDADKIPGYPFGPGLMSAVVLLTGVYHLSRRGLQRRAGLAPRRAHQRLHRLPIGEHSAARPRDRVRRPFEGRKTFLGWGLFPCQHMRLC